LTALAERPPAPLAAYRGPDDGPDRLAELEAAIAQALAAGTAAFIAAGRALEEIQTARLYRVTHGTFAAYLRERWALSPQAAHNRVTSAQIAGAIEAAGLELPDGATAETLKPLAPVLHQLGPAGVADAWRTVLDATAGKRPSGRQVRDVLERRHLPATAPPRQRAELAPVRRSLERTLARAARFRDEHAGAVPPASVRRSCSELAAMARELAELLERLADTAPAERRLATVEAPAVASGDPHKTPIVVEGFGVSDDPADGASDLCLNHGARLLPNGRCAGCGRRGRGDVRVAA
jgi:hypothetical protein